MDSTWFSCYNIHKSVEMSFLKVVSMCAESGMWSRYPALNSAFEMTERQNNALLREVLYTHQPH
jgi:hypothetical protein